jgi:hypothetical protein
LGSAIELNALVADGKRPMGLPMVASDESAFARRHFALVVKLDFSVQNWIELQRLARGCRMKSWTFRDYGDAKRA